MTAEERLAARLSVAIWHGLPKADPQNFYSRAVIAEIGSIEGYFRVMAAIALEPPSKALVRRFYALEHPDALFLLDTTLEHLDDLPADEREIADAVRNLLDWMGLYDRNGEPGKDAEGEPFAHIPRLPDRDEGPKH